MDYKIVEKNDWRGKKVKVLDETYEPGIPEVKDAWRAKIQTREQALRYLDSAERYWYSDEWFGSEKRR